MTSHDPSTFSTLGYLCVEACNHLHYTATAESPTMSPTEYSAESGRAVHAIVDDILLSDEQSLQQQDNTDNTSYLGDTASTHVVACSPHVCRILPTNTYRSKLRFAILTGTWQDF